MVVAINKHNVKWLSPSPTWGQFDEFESDEKREKFAQPNILRFNNDMFMDELLSVMTYYPDKLIEWKAKQETWRQPMATPKTAAKLSLNESPSVLKTRQTREVEKLNQKRFHTQEIANEKTFQTPPLEDEPLKLYQPSQKRFYLVCASLVCQQRGLPDRVVDSGRQEQVSFVLRRLAPKASSKTPLFDCIADSEDKESCDEYALIQTDGGLQWKNIAGSGYSVKETMTDEERLPMFTVGFSDIDNRKRRLLAGLIPVGKREAYLCAPQYEEANTQTNGSEALTDQEKRLAKKKEAIKSLFVMQVIAPWKAMIEQVEHEKRQRVDINGYYNYAKANNELFKDVEMPANVVDEFDEFIKSSREQIQTTSWYVLVDFATFLHDHIHNIWLVLKDELDRSQLDPEKEEPLLAEIEKITIGALKSTLDNETYYSNSQISNNMAEALSKIIKSKNTNRDIAVDLDRIELVYDQNEMPDYGLDDPKWPSFLFPLADPVQAAPLRDLTFEPDPETTTEPDISLAILDEFTKLVINALSVTADEAPEIMSFTSPSEDTNLDPRNGVFVIRCIYERPNCGPFNPAIVSKPTEPFQMASFFDPDAPARQFLIPSPIDPSPSGIRKFNKNTTFMISDMLCGKLSRIREITFGDLVLSVLPWPFHKDLPSASKPGPCKKGGNPFGMFCSLSIPIVTLCAMILLIIMVTLFDIFFRWLPLLFVCFPLPGFKGKKP